jgi:hypothetical protein
MPEPDNAPKPVVLSCLIVIQSERISNVSWYMVARQRLFTEGAVLRSL